eukprot:scaffold301_cov393-Prasinococcus_capsulatus_cf.AAC.14
MAGACAPLALLRAHIWRALREAEAEGAARAERAGEERHHFAPRLRPLPAPRRGVCALTPPFPPPVPPSWLAPGRPRRLARVAIGKGPRPRAHTE